MHEREKPRWYNEQNQESSARDQLGRYGLPSNFENEKLCPYNPDHLVREEKLQAHLIRCRRDILNKGPGHPMYNAVSNYQVCPFDANHRLPQAEMESHMSECPGRLEVIKTTSSRREITPSWREAIVQTRSEEVVASENWENGEYQPTKLNPTHGNLILPSNSTHGNLIQPSNSTHGNLIQPSNPTHRNLIQPSNSTHRILIQPTNDRQSVESNQLQALQNDRIQPGSHLNSYQHENNSHKSHFNAVPPQYPLHGVQSPVTANRYLASSSQHQVPSNQFQVPPCAYVAPGNQYGASYVHEVTPYGQYMTPNVAPYGQMMAPNAYDVSNQGNFFPAPMQFYPQPGLVPPEPIYSGIYANQGYPVYSDPDMMYPEGYWNDPSNGYQEQDENRCPDPVAGVGVNAGEGRSGVLQGGVGRPLLKAVDVPETNLHSRSFDIMEDKLKEIEMNIGCLLLDNSDEIEAPSSGDGRGRGRGVDRSDSNGGRTPGLGRGRGWGIGGGSKHV